MLQEATEKLRLTRKAIIEAGLSTSDTGRYPTAGFTPQPIGIADVIAATRDGTIRLSALSQRLRALTDI